MAALHTVSAVIEAGAGVALLCCPSATAVLLLGTPLDAPTAFTVARVGGAGLLSLGIACWLARRDGQASSATPEWVRACEASRCGRGCCSMRGWPSGVCHACAADPPDCECQAM